MITVKLEIIHDGDTGLTCAVYRWIDKQGISQLKLEIANRCSVVPNSDHTYNPLDYKMLAMKWDDKVDGDMAEFQRAVFEDSLNTPEIVKL